MYQLLTGQLPFQAHNCYDMIYQIIHAEPPRPSTLRKEVPAALDAIVARAMSKRVATRYANWQEFAQDLAQAFRDRKPTRAVDQIADLEKFDTLRSFPFFADFSDVEIWEVVRFSEWSRAQPGTAIIRDGELGDFFCFLAEGELKVLKNGLILDMLTAGECFGEMAVIGKATSKRGADIVAVTEVKLVRITARALRKSSESCRVNFYQSFLAVLSERLTAANVRLVTF